jgi:hypothetical protein
MSDAGGRHKPLVRLSRPEQGRLGDMKAAPDSAHNRVSPAWQEYVE